MQVLFFKWNSFLNEGILQAFEKLGITYTVFDYDFTDWEKDDRFLELFRRALGKTEADCYVISNLSDNQKKKLMIADNKVYSLGVDNNEMLDKIIADLGDDLDIPGYDEEVLRQMNAEAATITEQISGYGRLDDTQIGEIRQAGERRDEHIAQAQTPEAGSTEVTDSQEAGEHATAVPQTETEAGRYVICPNCGERIWF